MLARVARSAASQSSKRSLSSTAATAKAFQASDAAPSVNVAAVSSGELAWCEIYGVNYDEQVQEALDEAPLLVNDTQRPLSTHTTAAASPSAAAANAKHDIWNVVFGSASGSA